MPSLRTGPAVPQQIQKSPTSLACLRLETQVASEENIFLFYLARENESSNRKHISR